MAPGRSRGGAAASVSRFWGIDEEMAKKDDDLRLPSHARGKHSGQWQAARSPRRSFIARMILYLIILSVIVLALYKGIESALNPSLSQLPTDDQLSPKPPDIDRPIAQPRPPPPKPAEDAVKGDGEEDEKTQGQDNAKGGEASKDTLVVDVGSPNHYKGPLRLPSLGATLRLLTGTDGSATKNHNILFAACSLRSASILLPMACQMSEGSKNQVHFAIMGATDISIKNLLTMNGIDKECQIRMHDARPDHAMISSTERLSLASSRALYHINSYMHPQAVVIDSSAAEDATFLSAIHEQISDTSASLIQISERGAQRLSWITKMDSAALAAWDHISFDILIHIPPGGAGNLKRLLRSITRADLGAGTIPHITIDLPPQIDSTMNQVLTNFQWPPKDQGVGASLVSLRHRIPRQKLTVEESSVRFLESFWPVNPSNSHVLILSSNTELSSQFFNYLKYSVLQHRYSSFSTLHDWHKTMLGVSFASPQTLLDGKKPFVAPTQASDAPGGDMPFLWQAPNSDAMLIFGDKWVELHDYAYRALEARSSSSSSSEFLTRKQVSKQHPAWLEFLLQLSRLRGYLTVYPGQQIDTAVLGVHRDLNSEPEEYQGTDHEGDGEYRDSGAEAFDITSSVDMLATLPGDGALPRLRDMPVLSWDGSQSKWKDIESEASDLVDKFRREVGQCKDDSERPQADERVAELFCDTIRL